MDVQMGNMKSFFKNIYTFLFCQKVSQWHEPKIHKHIMQ